MANFGGMEMRKADSVDTGRIVAITDSARLYQRQCGFRQWEDGYPASADIAADIAAGCAYVFIEGGEIAAYAFLPEGDGEYDRMCGIWRYAPPYGVIHRLAVSPRFRGRGLASEVFSMAEEYFRRQGIRAMRVDTGEANVVMQRVLRRCGYECRGTVRFAWGMRLAYEKEL